MLKIKCKVMLNVALYFIINFIIVYSNDIINDYNFRQEYNSNRQEGMCDLHNKHVSFNFNKLYKKEGYTVRTNDKIFYLNICGYAPQCGTNTTVCYKNKNNLVDIRNTQLSDIFIGFEEIKYKISKLKILFICDRHLNKANITCEKNGMYHFKFKTPIACYPKPTECRFQNKGESFVYDISSLKPTNNNNWDVRNVPKNYKIYLNICGKLNLIPGIQSDSDCLYEGTQLCLVYNNGSSKNLGVFSDPMQLEDDRLYLSITGGSLCDGSDTITTNIEFICSVNESGPVFTSNTTCSFNIKWLTPTVCPHIIDEISECNLKPPIFASHQMKFQTNNIQLNSSHFIKYNVCEHFNCNGNKQTLFCLINNKNKKEIVLGFNNNDKLTSYDGLLSASYSGDKCASNNATNYRINLQFNCDYTKHKQPDVKLSDNGCTINVTIHTKDVCRDYEPVIPAEQCSTFTNTSGQINYYNITGLTLTDRNYEIRDTNNPNLVYILNVCQPVVFQAGTFCDPAAIVCMRNDSMGNIYHKSKNLGHYTSTKLIVAQNDSLLLQFVGSLSTFSANDYFASIEFICNNKATNSLPVLISNTDYEYYFQWETSHACPLPTNNTLPTAKDNRIYKELPENLTKVRTTTSTTTSSTSTSTTSTPATSTSTTSISKPTSTSTSISKPTSTSTSISKPTSTSTSTTSIPKPTSTSLIVPINIKVSNTSGLFVRNCSIQDFNMNNLPKNINVTSNTGRTYSLDICSLRNSEDCSLDNCLSNLKKDALNNLIEMDFHGKTKCRNNRNGYFNSVIFIKCSLKEPSKLSILKEEMCSVHLEWRNSAVCAVLQEKPKVSPNIQIESPVSSSGPNIATIISSVFGLLLILCVSVLASIYFWRKRQVNSSPSCLTRCDYNKIKDAAKIV